MTPLYYFCAKSNCVDGGNPNYALTMDKNGFLYGVVNDGANGAPGGVFQISPQGVNSPEVLLYSFCQQTNCPDGASPFSSMIVDDARYLYGTTSGGGDNGAGVVFRLRP